LLPCSYNPRSISDEQKKQLIKSLQKFNLAEIPAVNTDNQILAGHQRIAVLITLGRGEELIDVRIPNRKLTKQEADEYMLRSNLNTGDWDFSILGKDFNFDLSSAGNYLQIKEQKR
jgi:site-specific DNA-methyltransferase (adenine-specific)